MKVKYSPWQPHCLAFGGLEIQMLSTLKAVQKCGVDASKLDAWDRDRDFDIIHIWGFDHTQENIVHYGLRGGKKIVITSLFQNFDNPIRKYKHLVSQYFGIAKCMIKIAKEAHEIVVVNDIEADIAMKYFKIPNYKITYIPNIVDEKYYNTFKILPQSYRGIPEYVLCTGNICERKNQLNLAKACKLAGLNLIVIGKILPGEEFYGNSVLRIINETSGFLHIENLPENSDELISAYQNCSIFALPSNFEQGPISAYEALVCGNKLLIADRRYAYQEFYQKVKRINPDSIIDIKNGLLEIMKNPFLYEQPINIMEPCKSVNVGEKYKSLYEKMMNNK